MVKCEICGRQFRTITNTHLKGHGSGMTQEDYKAKFPGAKLFSEETSRLKSDCMKGKNKGRSRPDARERMNCDNPMKNAVTREKMGKTRSSRISKGEIDALKNLGHLPTAKEKLVGQIFQDNNIPLIYVGDGKLWLGNRCPDFVCEEKKIVLELDLDFFRHEEEKHELTSHYSSFGYRLILLCTIEKEAVVNWVKPFFEGSRWVKIKKISRENTTGKKKVYNFHVSPNNNYFADSVLVHNCFADAFRATLYTSFFDNSRTMGLRSADPAFFLPELDKYFSGKGTGDIQQAIKQRIPIRVGIRFEDFLPIERKRGAALALLNHLKENVYPVMINSKSDLIAREPYLSALGDNKARAAVHVTLITADNDMLRRIEPGAPSYAKRLETMRTLSAAGVRVVARIEPFMVFINDDPDMVQKYIEDVYATGCRNITFDTYSYSANNPGIRSSFYNIGYDFGRMFTLISDSQAIGSLLLGKFMDLFRARGFSCSTFDLGNVPRNDDEICCEVGNWFTESRFNLGSSVSAIRYIQSRRGEKVSWKDFERHVIEKGGFLSDELKKSIFETWNMKGNSAYFISWGSGIEAAGEDSAGVTIWRYTDEYDFRERILENCL